jgi:hypothetical protein
MADMRLDIAGRFIKDGDRVRVVGKAQSYERGWDNDWVTEMDKYVGKVLVADIRWDDSCMKGIQLVGSSKPSGGMYRFPGFVLSKDLRERRSKLWK